MTRRSCQGQCLKSPLLTISHVPKVRWKKCGKSINFSAEMKSRLQLHRPGGKQKGLQFKETAATVERKARISGRNIYTYI